MALKSNLVLFVSFFASFFTTCYLQACAQGIPHSRNYFYVGGHYNETSNGHFFVNQMYVEKLTPLNGTARRFPLIFVHGNTMTGTNWLNTPDGREGWAFFFLGKGYEVYIVDQVDRARSPRSLDDPNAFMSFSAEQVEQRFTDVKDHALWPQAKKHTQWPGTGKRGDPTFDAFYASTVPSLSNNTVVQLRMKAALEALLDKVGPGILVTHSQSGTFGWPAADARPNLVKAVYAIEPMGPPFHEVIFDNSTDRAWGPTDIPLTYDPPVRDPSEIRKHVVKSSQPDLFDCILQSGKPRQLVNIKKVPVRIQVSQASYHATYDHCTAMYLEQAGVNVSFVRLEDFGIFGNAHMQFLEKNNLQIAEFVNEWVDKIV